MNIDKAKADDYVEVVFDDILDRSENAALWIHADEHGDACIYITKGTEKRRRIFQAALVASMLDDPEILEDFAVAVTRAMSIRAEEERGGVSWSEELEP